MKINSTPPLLTPQVVDVLQSCLKIYTHALLQSDWAKDEKYKFEFAYWLTPRINFQSQTDQEVLDLCIESQQQRYTGSKGVNFILSAGREKRSVFITMNDIMLFRKVANGGDLTASDLDTRGMSFTGLSSWLGTLFPDVYVPIAAKEEIDAFRKIWDDPSLPLQGYKGFSTNQPYGKALVAFIETHGNEVADTYKKEIGITSLSRLFYNWLAQDFTIFIKRELIDKNLFPRSSSIPRTSVGTMQKSNFTLNTILYGPPGTGKTYNTIELAVELITGKKDSSHATNKKTFDLLKKEGQIEFITFHQNYSYEDFVVGIKPDLDNADLKFRKNEGIFYQICERAKTNYYQSQIPASGTSLRPFDEVFEDYTSPLVENGDELEVKMKSGKSFQIREINGNSIKLRYASGSEEHSMGRSTLKKAYEDRDGFESKRIITGGMYTYFKAVLERLWEMGKQTNVVTPLRNYVLIIDEINRANISRVFGELITLLEEDKRLGAENELRLTLPNSEQNFALPPNLYIMGTMNTADKSIALVDIALRRRFEFKGFYPTKSVIDQLSAEGKIHKDVPGLLTALNKKVFDKKGADFLVGHAYFINKITDQDLYTTLRRKIIPLLMEYFSGKVDLVRDLFSNSGYEVSYDTENYDWTIAKA